MSNILSKSSRPRRSVLGGLAPFSAMAAALLFTSQAFGAQAPAGPQPTPGTQTAPGPSQASAQPGATNPAQTSAPAQPGQPDEPPQPEIPKWPVNETPNKANVTWDSQGLRIQATNSSLHQILNDISTDTGAKVEGMGTDERVFGEYGPGTASDVISQLLHGSSYNVLLIGDQGSGTPREIVLSARRSGPSQPQANRQVPQDQGDEDIPDQPEPDDQSQQPPLINGRPPMPMVPQGPPGAPRTPQQVLQELQQRQQQIQDQQQQQQQPH